jgi:hypothetical protein
MNVREFVEILNEFEPDLEVYFFDTMREKYLPIKNISDYGIYPVRKEDGKRVLSLNETSDTVKYRLVNFK